MPSVILKGHKEGYEFILKDVSSFNEIKKEIDEILKRVQNEKTSKGDKLTFALNTGNRLLNQEQRTEIEEIFENYPRFSIRRINADVLSKKSFLEFLDNRTIHLCCEIIRTGQIKEMNGDVLFCGSVHKGGILKATGSIFVLGSVEGVIHAGAKNDALAVVCGNMAHAQQVRIADLVEIVSETDYEDMQKLIYVNDLHVLDTAEVTELKTIRPKVFTQNGGLI